MRDTYEEGQIYQRRIDALQKDRDGMRHDYLDAMAQLDQATQECVAIASEHEALRGENAELKQRCAKLEGALRPTIDALEETANNCCECDACKSAALGAEVVVFRAKRALAPDSGADCGTKEETECNCWVSGLVGHAEQCPKHKDQ